MKSPLLATLALAFIGAGASPAATIVYDNTAKDTLITYFYSTGPYIGIGDAITLGGTDRVLDSATATAKQSGCSNAKAADVKSRDVARAIVIYAEDNGFDHIVVGTGGKSGLSRLMLGSVSRDMVARAHCAVTVAR